MNNVESMFAPMVKTNQMMASHVEKLVRLQMSSAQNYVDMMLEQMKTLAGVSNPQQAQECMKKSVDMLNAMRQKMMDDVKSMTELGTEMKNDFTKLAEENASELTKATKAAAERAASSVKKAA
ncbi:MAG: phasin family protein [Candidatus Competibacterales bacterium]